MGKQKLIAALSFVALTLGASTSWGKAKAKGDILTALWQHGTPARTIGELGPPMPRPPSPMARVARPQTVKKENPESLGSRAASEIRAVSQALREVLPFKDAPSDQHMALKQVAEKLTPREVLMAIDKNDAGALLEPLLKPFRRDLIDASLPTEFEQPPIARAAQLGSLQMVKAWLEAGAQLDRKDTNGYTALHEAAYSGFAPIVEILIEGGADVDVLSRESETPLMLAARRGHTEVVELLIQARAQLNLHDANNDTALIYSTWKQHHSVLRLLVQAQAELDRKGYHDDTALIVAAWHDVPTSVDILLEAGASWEPMNKQGEHALLIAARSGNLSTTEILLQAGARFRNSRDFLSRNKVQAPMRKLIQSYHEAISLQSAIVMQGRPPTVETLIHRLMLQAFQVYLHDRSGRSQPHLQHLGVVDQKGLPFFSKARVRWSAVGAVCGVAIDCVLGLPAGGLLGAGLLGGAAGAGLLWAGSGWLYKSKAGSLKGSVLECCDNKWKVQYELRLENNGIAVQDQFQVVLSTSYSTLEPSELLDLESEKILLSYSISKFKTFKELNEARISGLVSLGKRDAQVVLNHYVTYDSNLGRRKGPVRYKVFSWPLEGGDEIQLDGDKELAASCPKLLGASLD